MSTLGGRLQDLTALQTVLLVVVLAALLAVVVALAAQRAERLVEARYVLPGDAREPFAPLLPGQRYLVVVNRRTGVVLARIQRRVPLGWWVGTAWSGTAYPGGVGSETGAAGVVSTALDRAWNAQRNALNLLADVDEVLTAAGSRIRGDR